MKSRWLQYSLLVFLFSLAAPYAQSGQAFDVFVTRSGDKLMEGSKEFRFVSFNIPNLHYIEDNLPFEQTNPWRLPNSFEITDALAAVKQMGGTAVRIYALSVRKPADADSIPSYVRGPGQFNEEAFRALDQVMQIANETGVRIIIPFVDQWSWFGGIAEYGAFRGKAAAEFWTDPQLIDDFKQTVRYLVNRRNVFTGVTYRDDKALLAWETGNELSNPYSWSKEIAAYLKQIDPNHLVLDGFHAGARGVSEDAIADPNIDIISTHHYGNASGDVSGMIQRMEKARAITAGRKPYVIGEVGFIPTEGARQVLDMVIQKGLSGALFWSLRFHSRDGGFYWHSEPSGNGLYKAYHWPGFPTGAAYDETNLLRLMREKAFEIREMKPPPLDPPAAPILLPIASVNAISWQGSTGASSYEVERAPDERGSWTAVGMNLDDTAVQYRPLFSDSFAVPGRKFFYRVHALNSAGSSPPSNVIGPVDVPFLSLVDEMGDFSRIFAHSSDLSLETQKARQAKEDGNRIKGAEGSYLIYRTLPTIRAARFYAYFMLDIVDFAISTSKDGMTFTRTAPIRKDFYGGSGSYGYWKNVIYEIANLPAGNYFLKIEYRTEAQIGRVEIMQNPPD